MATQAPSILVKKCMLAVPGLANDKPLKSPVADQDLLRDKPTEDPDHKVISKARQSKLNTIGMAD